MNTPSSRTSPPLVIGLTGGIGSGKSAAADRFVELGASLVDTDAIAHALTAPRGAAMAAIRAQFGAELIAEDGSLDRAAMRARVFADAAARRQLEAILHPLIGAESARQRLAAQGLYVILAVPLLIESGDYRARCDRVCVVDVPPEIQIERVRARSALDEAQIRAIMAAQASRAQRLAIADDIVVNDGHPDHLHAAVAELDTRYRALAAQP